jgi:hypothetical protein
LQLASHHWPTLADLVGHLHGGFVIDLAAQMMVRLMTTSQRRIPANIFTRVQISFIDGIRVRDIVVIDDDWGAEHPVGLPASAAILGIIAGHRRDGWIDAHPAKAGFVAAIGCGAHPAGRQSSRPGEGGT